MHNIDNITVTHWGNYEIVVRTSKDTTGTSRDGVISSYEITRAGKLLVDAVIPAAYADERSAAESALRIAKLDARDSLGAPCPGY